LKQAPTNDRAVFGGGLGSVANLSTAAESETAECVLLFFDPHRQHRVDDGLTHGRLSIPVDLSESLEHQREQRLPAYICVTLVRAVQKPGDATTRWAICRQALAGAVVLDDVKRYVPPVLVQLNAV